MFGAQTEGEVIRLYASASELEHGPAFRNPGTGEILVFELRPDGFVSLSAEGTATVATRERVWHGGEVQLNIKAKRATVAVYITDESEIIAGGNNALAIARPLDGYTHADCEAFSGDTTSWTPIYKSGLTVDALKGKTIVFEVKYESGELYSISGNCTEVFNTEAARFRKYGILPG